MAVDTPFPAPLDILLIHDKDDKMIMEVPLCEVVKGDVESVDKDIVKMKSFETGEITPWKKNDFLLEIQDSFQRLDIAYVEIILGKDHTKIRI